MAPFLICALCAIWVEHHAPRMKKETLSGRQLTCLTALYIIGSSSVIGNSGIAGKDSWIAVLLATIAALPIALIYARVVTLYPGQNLFDIICSAFGEIIGKIIVFATTLYAFWLGVMVLRDFPEFVRTASLPRTPGIFVALILAVVCAYLARLGASSFGKAGALFAFIVSVVVVFTFLLLIPNMELKYIRPVMATPLDIIALNSAKLVSSPFGETVLLLCLYCNLKEGKSPRRAFVWGLLFGGLYLALGVVRNILTLGPENFSSLYFPSYNAVSTINIGDFLQRLEVMVTGYLLICDIIKISIAIYATCLGLQKLFHLQSYKSFVFPVAFMMAPLSLLAFGSTMRFYDWTPAYFFVTLPFELLIPVILWLVGEVRRMHSQKQHG